MEENDAPPSPSRSQNVVYTLPSEWSTIAQFLSSAVERVDPSQAATQVLVLTGDNEGAVAITSAVARLSQGRGITALPVTGARRAQRFLKEGPAHVVAGTPGALAELVGGAALKLDAVRTVVVAWADDLLGGVDEEGAAVETVLAEVPKEAARIVVTSDASPAVESFVERYLRRPRRVGRTAGAGGGTAVDMEVVTTSPGARPDVLRRVLDELDPASAAIVVRDPDSEAQARRILAALGYAADDSAVRISHGPIDTGTELAVLYDVPLSAEALEETTTGGPRRTVALASPRQLAHLRSLAGGGRVAPLSLGDTARRARRREERLREELRNELAAGFAARELLAIEPLLEEHDAAEVAAAALRLLDRARAGARAEVQQATMSFASAAAPGWVRVFMTVGERDGAQRGDLVGAIANESGITSDQIGKIDLRDTHSIVQIAAPVAEKVIEAMNGSQVKGRRVAARLERERAMSAGLRRLAEDTRASTANWGGDDPAILAAFDAAWSRPRG
ncbi:MAG: DbpA RNA binding domain-containing protein, partial [Gemmatimonadaceae bacterium]